MSREELRDDLSTALQAAIVSGVDPDDIKGELEDAKRRVDQAAALGVDG